MLNAGPRSDRLTLTLDDASPHPAVEMWTAELITVCQTQEAPRRSGAHRLIRVDLDDPEWTSALKALSRTAREIGTAFEVMRDAADVDEEVLYADSLVILDEEFPTASARCQPLLAAVAKAFRNDVVAMLELRTEGGDVRDGWEGFTVVPGTRVAMLPFYLRR